MNCFLNGADCLRGLTELDASQCKSVVGVRPVFPDFNSFLKLFLSFLMLSIFLIVARQVEDRWCVLWVEFKSLFIAFECRLKGGFVLILVQDYAFMIPKLWVHVRIELLGRRLALSVSRVSILHLTLR